MALRLIIEDEEGATTIVPLGEEEVTIGREPGNTIQLTEQNVSRQHARLAQGPDGWVIEDLESYNGVKVNGVLVEGSVTLNEGDVVQIGDYHLALSNNVEQTTLNIDRPGQAANEPNRVMPSVELPRLSATEAAAITAPSYTNGEVQGLDQGGEHEREGGGRGLWLGLGLVAVLGVGFIAMRMLGPGEGPAKVSNDKATPAADTKAAPRPVVPQPVVPEPVTPEPTDPTQATPPDPSGEGEPEPEEPTKKPIKPTDKIKKPITPPPLIEKPDTSKSDALALLEEARAANWANNYSQAYDFARKSYDLDRNSTTLKVMGVAACHMGDQAKAKAVYKKLDAVVQKQLYSVCLKNDIQLEP